MYTENNHLPHQERENTVNTTKHHRSKWKVKFNQIEVAPIQVITPCRPDARPPKQRVKRPPITGAQTEDVRSDWSSLKGWTHRIGHDPGNVHRCRWYRVFLVINERVDGLIIENFSPVKMAYMRSYQKGTFTYII